MIPELGTSVASISVFTASLLTKRLLLTLARRSESSDKPWYNRDTKKLEIKQVKDDYFLGFQYSVTKSFMAGAFYNYFMLHELAFTGTLFF